MLYEAALRLLIKHHVLSLTTTADFTNTVMSIPVTMYEQHMPHVKYYDNRVSILRLKQLFNDTGRSRLARELVSCLYQTGIGLPISDQHQKEWHKSSVVITYCEDQFKELRQHLKQHIVLAQKYSPDGYAYGEEAMSLNETLTLSFLGRKTHSIDKLKSLVHKEHGSSTLHLAPTVAGVPSVLLYRYTAGSFKLYSSLIRNRDRTKYSIPANNLCRVLNSVPTKIDQPYASRIRELGYKEGEYLAVIGTMAVRISKTVNTLSGPVRVDLIKQLKTVYPDIRDQYDLVYKANEEHDDLHPRQGFLKSAYIVRNKLNKEKMSVNRVDEMYSQYKKLAKLGQYIDFIPYDIYRYNKQRDRLIVMDLDRSHIAQHLSSVGFTVLDHHLIKNTTLGTSLFTQDYVEKFKQQCSVYKDYKVTGLRVQPNTKYRVGARKATPFIIKL